MGMLALCVLGMGLSSPDGHGCEHARPLRLGVLTDSWGPTPPIVGLRDGLVDLGYHENVDFVLGIRFTQGDRTVLPVAARQLVEAGAVLLFADSNSTAQAVQQATTRIPIVFAAVEDPVGAGLVQRFARAGGNITGVAPRDIVLGPKRLQVFHELVPALTRVVFLYAVTDIAAEAAARLYQEAAHRLGLAFVAQGAHTQEEVQTRLAQVQPHEGEGIIAPRCCALDIPGLILEAATRQRIPPMFGTKTFWIEHGALASFVSSVYAAGHQAARLVDKILKGVPPAEIPVEANTTIEFTINLTTADALGLVIAPDVLYAADYLVR